MFRWFYWFALIVPVFTSNEEKIFKSLGNVLGVPDLRDQLLTLYIADPKSECFIHISAYVAALLKGEKWALQMFDSVEKFPYGLLQFRATFLGNYDECISVKTENFKGKHCMVDVDLCSSQSPNQLFGKATYFYGLCIPSTCYGSDIEKLAEILQISKVVNANISVDEENCWTNDPVKLSEEDWAAIFFLVCFGVIALGSTFLEYKCKNDTARHHELYHSFSLLKNWKQLMKIYRGPENIGCLHGIRTLTMCWVILAHQYVMGTMFTAMNNVVAVEYPRNKEKILISNSFVSVDTFFLLSGLLVTLVFFRDVSKKGSYDVPVAMIHRFIRITPAYAVMVFIQSTIILRFGSGPIWSKSVGMGVKTCRENWWSGLLYIQNFVSPNSVCLGQSWYLSSDMQMFWVSPLLLYPLLLWPKAGIVVFFVYLAGALATNFGVAFSHELGPQLFFPNKGNTFTIDYVQTYMRLVPYIVGMGLAYIICGVKVNKIRVNLSKTWVVLGWLASSALCLGSMYGIAYFIDNKPQNNVLQSAFYLAFHRLGWSLGIAWIIFSCFAGYGGWIDRFLSWDVFQVLGKLSYSMFLVHFSIQFCRGGMTRTATYLSDFEVVTSFFSTLLMSLMFALPLYLLFEAPFGHLDRYFFREVTILPYPRKKRETHAKETKNKEDAESPRVEGAENKGFEL